MKKKLIAAGAASLAVAAMPVVGVFATNNAATQGATTDDMVITDILSITVEDTCTFSATTGGASEGAFDTSYAATVANGAIAQFQVSNANKSDHVFGVVCNNNDGWTVSATQPVALAADGVSSSHNISYAAQALPDLSGENPTRPTEGYWNAVVSGTPVNTAYAVQNQTGITEVSSVKYISTAGGVIAKEAASTDGSTFTVTYGAYVGTETPAGTYTATSTNGDGDDASGSNGTNANDGDGTIDYILSVL